MVRHLLRALFVIPLAAAVASAAPPKPDPLALALRIDAELAARWQSVGVKPAPQADDAAFLRRVHLDIAGKVPTVSEVRRFLRDPSPDKRRRVVEELLDSPGYVNHFTSYWRTLLLPEAETNFNVRYTSATFEPWVRKHVSENTPYNQMVKELLTAPISQQMNGIYFDVYGGNGPATPLAFYNAKEYKPENIAAAVARTFLAVRIECAQCHDHPFARWKREQFWGQAAFFAGVRGQGQDGFYQPQKELLDRRELPIPGTERVAQATFLDGKEPRWKFRTSPRQTLAEWMTTADNPFFARAAVNRLWAHFFGVGFVDPVDDFNDQNQPSHPALLNEMSRQFAVGGFDVKFLIRAFTLSQAYQLASEPSPDDPRLFNRMAVKGMTGEQIFDSFCVVTGFKDGVPRAQRFYNFGDLRSEFIAKFAQAEKRTEHHTSIPQALALMNGQLVADATSPDRGVTLGAVIDAPFLDTASKIETLYLAALTRKPRAEELQKMVKYVEGGGPKRDNKRALADVFWALLNSGEFILNH